MCRETEGHVARRSRRGRVRAVRRPCKCRSPRPQAVRRPCSRCFGIPCERSARLSFRATLCPNSPSAQRPIPFGSPGSGRRPFPELRAIGGVERCRRAEVVLAGREPAPQSCPKERGRSLAPGRLPNQRVRWSGGGGREIRRGRSACHDGRRTARSGGRLPAGA